MLVWVLGVAALAYLLMIGGMVLFQRAMIFHPGGPCPEPAEAGLPEMIAVPVCTEDNLVVTGWYGPPARPDCGTVLLFHGNSGTLANRAWKARILLEAGYGVFLAGYRGYGGNPGSPSEQGLYSDGRAALAWLAAQGVAPHRLALYGESLGTGVAVNLAGEAEIGAVVLEAPFTRLPDLAPPLVGSALASLLMADHFDNLAKIGGVTAPLLIIHGEHDTTVPVTMGRRLLAASEDKGEATFLAAAGHNDLWKYGAGNAVLDFLGRHLG